MVLDDGTRACIELRNPGDRVGTVYLWRSPFSIVIEGSVDDDEMMTAANHVVPSETEPGFEILPAGLPAGVEQTGVGWGVSDFAAVSFEAATDPMVSTHWEDDSGRTIFSVVTTDDAPLLANHRFGYETVIDVTVRGVPGFVRTIGGEPNYLGVVWQHNGLTYTFGSQGFEEAELLTIVEQLRPATQEDWDTMRSEATSSQAAIATAPESTAPMRTVDRMP